MFLYFRQILILFVALFTTRIVINSLGIDDYGLYNLIAGIITMLNIVSASLTTATQRFLSMSLGRNDLEEFRNIYNVCNTLFILLSIVIFILGELLGTWFLNTYLVIPDDRLVAANWCYQLSLLSFILGILRVPSNAVIISYEKMDFYALLSIVEVVLQLIVAYVLYLVRYDKLICYSVLILSVTFLVNSLYIIYCRVKLNTRMRGFSLNSKLLSSIFSFSFWTFFGSLATIGTKQGINILINMFFGIRLNAASAVATKVSSTSYSFVSNFTTAYRPQIMKLYSVGSYEELNTLVYKMTKLSSYLFFFIMIPIYINIDAFLSLWLGNVPEYAAVFCKLLIIYLFIDAIQSPLLAMVHAIGNIKRFQIVLSCLLILNLPIMWVLLKINMPVESVYICYICLNIISSIYRTIYVVNKSSINLKQYVIVVIRVLITLVLSYLLCHFQKGIWPDLNAWISLIINVVISFLITSVIIFFIGLVKPERKYIYNLIIKRIGNK